MKKLTQREEMACSTIARLEAELGQIKSGGWIKCSERLPETPPDSDTTFIVAVFRANVGKTFVFTAEWLNEKLLNHEDPGPDDPEDGVPFTGWHSLEDHADYTEFYEPLIEPGSGDEVTHWQSLPAPPTE